MWRKGLPLMQDAHNRDAEVRAQVEHDVAFERETQDVLRQFIARAAEQRLMCQFGQPAL